MIPRKGAEVAKISEKSLRDVLEVRRSLEELAIELACQRMTDEEIEQYHVQMSQKRYSHPSQVLCQPRIVRRQKKEKP